ncbi:MAG: hypothetical protein J9259_10080 [Thermoplasmata archaeon YP2-bin.285]|uniref:Uncharacterized protein n=1 Tax=Candidatus Sysuiplasma superficiale TaxID=2823368 RepID=A0A8J7YQ28_9ARCH|nr:hypothetical protein [Candidatus Sysuiplasma superficiale]
MDLRCGCCGGEISWAAPDVLRSAPKEEVIIFTCEDCKCGYDTSAQRTHWCDKYGRRDFVFQSKLNSRAMENKREPAYKQIRMIRKSDRLTNPSPITKGLKKLENASGALKETEGRSFVNILFELLFGC